MNAWEPFGSQENLTGSQIILQAQSRHSSIHFLNHYSNEGCRGVGTFFLANTEQEVEYTPSRIL